MANNVRNVVTITGPREDRNRLRELVDGETSFDLNKVIPMPESLNISEGFPRDCGMAIVQFRETGHSEELSHLMAWMGMRTEAELADYLEKWDEECRSSPKPPWFERPADWDQNLVEHGRRCLLNIAQHGFPTWSHWRRKHWGTIGNTYDCSLTSNDKKRLAYEFNTAWYDPRPIFEVLKKMFPSLTIKVKVSGEVERPYSYTL